MYWYGELVHLKRDLLTISHQLGKSIKNEPNLHTGDIF